MMCSSFYLCVIFFLGYFGVWTRIEGCEECSSGFSQESEPSSYRFFLPTRTTNGYFGTGGYGYNSGAYGLRGTYGGGQYDPSNPYFGNPGLNVRWSVGNYEISGYLVERSLGSNRILQDGYIDPENRPRCPIQNFDRSGRRPLSRSAVSNRREHREGRILLQNEYEIEIENSYEDDSGDGGSYLVQENEEQDSQGRWKFPSPFRQTNPYYPSGNNLYNGNYFGGQSPFRVTSSVGSLPYASGCVGGCTWEAELICQLSVAGEDVRWTRYHDNAFYPRGRYHDVLDYFGSRARIDTVEDGSLSKLIIYQVRPGDKGTYACENWNWGDASLGYGQQGGSSGTQKEIRTIAFYPQFPSLEAPVC